MHIFLQVQKCAFIIFVQRRMESIASVISRLLMLCRSPADLSEYLLAIRDVRPSRYIL
ncbi:unnamed protein product [Staurois parvus]|uniref:Uncharacterized protein n=1 Tax=Staurois parvus TaxID=386267 RepID=A0ABN9CGC8_9NEOB|nr:unnamed protein product [Staurois parvus]